MDFFDIEFDDSFIGGNWLTGVRATPSACKRYIQNGVFPCVGKKGLKYANQQGIAVCAMGEGSNGWGNQVKVDAVQTTPSLNKLDVGALKK